MQSEMDSSEKEAKTTPISDTQARITAMAAEGKAITEAVGEPVAESIAGWLNSQYLAAAHERLAAADPAQRLELLGQFARDCARFRRGDQRAERLRLDHTRLMVTVRNMNKRWEDKTYAGMDELVKNLRADPDAEEAVTALDKYFEKTCNDPDKSILLKRLEEPEICKEALPHILRGLSPETLKKVYAELHLESEPSCSTQRAHPAPTQNEP